MDKFVKEVFWNIKSMDEYRSFYKTGIIENDKFASTYEFINNLAYSTQYLEYINNSLKYNLHSVIKLELIKTHVIVGIGIVESILYYFIKSNNLQSKSNYKEIAVIKANDKKIGENYLRVETKLLKKLNEPIDKEMNLDSMLKKAENHKIIGKDRTIYKELNKLRKLRNKVHLHLIEKNLDTDWNNFSNVELELIRRVLLKLILSEIFKYKTEEKKELFDFLIEK